MPQKKATTKKATTKKAAKRPAKKVAPKKKAAKKKTTKPVKKPAAKKQPKPEKPIGRVTHYFDNIEVAVIKLEGGKALKVGDKIRIEGGELDYEQPIKSLQVEHEEVSSVKSGDDFGTKVKKKVHEGYRVYKA